MSIARSATEELKQLYHTVRYEDVAWIMLKGTLCHMRTLDPPRVVRDTVR
jgi:hypothetical protein